MNQFTLYGMSRQRCFILWVLVFVLLLSPIARPDRSSAQGNPGLILEKAGNYAEAAMYYQRALYGLQEVWVKFWYYGDTNKAHKVMKQIIGEYQDRLNTCLQKARMSELQREHMESVNELWMSEYVDQELGGYKLAFAYRAEEAEKHGDFLFASKLRLAAAEYCQLVAIPYHEQLASKLEAQQQSGEAVFRRRAAEKYRHQATENEILARGDNVLAGIPGLQRPLSQPDVSQHYFKSYKVYHERVLAVKDGQWKTGRTPQQVAAILKEKGLKHADEDARYASVVVLANLGQREAMLMALADPSSRVRLTAAKALAETRWSDGWATCYGNPDAEVRKAVEPLLGTAGNQPLSRTPSITELLQGLESSSIDTRTFCQAAMQRISGKKEMSASAWWAWWRKLGNARPGLIRIEPDESVVADETIDFGAWWQSGQRSIQNRPNPLLEYSRSTKIHWRGYLVVTRSGDYQFYVRSRAEWRKAFDKHGVLYFTSPCTKLYINGRLVLPESSNVVEDAKTHTRIDYSKLINLKPGLHTILLELDVKSAGTGYAQSPCIRFYWGSEHFPRELVPAEHLIHFASE